MMNQNKNPIIRIAQKTDANKLKELNDIFNDEDDTTLSELEASLYENKQEVVVCAETGSLIVGICCVQLIKTMCFNWNYGLITELFVREEYRNIGIGTS
jgi:ribosomal protein S18 acetylase RimI-like enzyme